MISSWDNFILISTVGYNNKCLLTMFIIVSKYVSMPSLSWNSIIEWSATRRASTNRGLLTDLFIFTLRLLFFSFLYLCFFKFECLTVSNTILCLCFCFFSCTLTLPICFCHSNLGKVSIRTDCMVYHEYVLCLPTLSFF